MLSVAAVSTSVLIAAPTAARADSSIPLMRGSSLLVIGSRVFVSPGPSGSTIVVKDAAGVTTAGITRQSGATAMAANADGTKMFVALPTLNSISVIDTATLTETARYSTAEVGCPTDVVALGSVVWFSYACGETPGLGAVDTAADSPSAVAVVTTVSAEDVAGSPGRPDQLVVGTADDSIRVYTTSGVEATQSAEVYQPGGCNNMKDLAVSSAGDVLYLACAVPYRPMAFSLPAVTLLRTYGPDWAWPDSVAISATGHVASSADQLLTVWNAARVRTLRIDLGAEHEVVPGAIEWSSDGTKLYALTYRPYQNDTYRLRIYTDPLRVPSTLTVSAPSTAALGTAVRVTGKLTFADGAAAGGRTLTVRRRNYDGSWTTLPSVKTTSTGAYAFSNTPKGGPVAYSLRYAGDATYKPVAKARALTVSRKATSVTIKAVKPVVAYGTRASLLAHLGSHHEVDVVSVWARPYGATKWVLIRRGSVNSAGNIAASFVMRRRTAFKVTFAGDDRYAPASATTNAQSTAHTTMVATNHYATSGAYRLYRTAADTEFTATVAPNKAERSVALTAQRYYSGAWRTTDTVSFVLDGNSRVVVWDNNAVVGRLYRVRAHYPGDYLNTPDTSPWVYYRITG